jgi:hypothetical protein
MYISVTCEVAMLQNDTFSLCTEGTANGTANGTGSFAREESQPKLEGTDKTSPQTTTV